MLTLKGWAANLDSNQWLYDPAALQPFGRGPADIYGLLMIAAGIDWREFVTMLTHQVANAAYKNSSRYRILEKTQGIPPGFVKGNSEGYEIYVGQQPSVFSSAPNPWPRYDFETAMIVARFQDEREMGIYKGYQKGSEGWNPLDSSSFYPF